MPGAGAGVDATETEAGGADTACSCQARGEAATDGGDAPQRVGLPSRDIARAAGEDARSVSLGSLTADADRVAGERDCVGSGACAGDTDRRMGCSRLGVSILLSFFYALLSSIVVSWMESLNRI